jgi:hypothetical protein
VQARIQTGATVAALAIAVSALFFEQAPCATWIFIGLGALSIIAAFVNRTPVLHMLPWLGEPRVTIDMAQVVSPRGGPHHVMIQIGLKISRPIDDAVLDFFAPNDLLLWNTDEDGIPTHKGSFMIPSSEPLNEAVELSQHWARHAELRLGDGRLNFVLELHRPRTFDVRFRVTSPQLYKSKREEVLTVRAS